MRCVPRARRAIAAQTQAGVCLMHMQGEPRTMQESPHYNDVVAEVIEFLARERRACLDAGIGARGDCGRSGNWIWQKSGA